MIKNPRAEEVVLDCEPMTIQGAVNKTLILLGIVVLVAYFSWDICTKGFYDKAMLFTIISAISAFILAMIAFFKPTTAKITAPLYAACEGIVVGSVSFMYQQAYNGIVLNALAITLLTLLSMLLLYKTKIIQATPLFRKIIVTSTFAVAIFYLVGFIGALIGHPMTIFNGGLVGIGVSLLICGIAAFNFILDFDFIEQGNQRLPQYFEWYGALSLLVTVIWLYLEVLRLLAQLQKRN